MRDLIQEIERAVDLYLRGRADEAAEIGRGLLNRARGTPHAARVYRHVAQFLHACGDYADARELARQASSLARATRHPAEGLASRLAFLACELYEGQVAPVYSQMGVLMRQNADRLATSTFMSRVMLFTGKLDEATRLANETRGRLDDSGDDQAVPADLLLAELLLIEGKAHILSRRPDEAAGLLERAMALELPTLVPGTLARAMLGLACTQLGDEARGRELAEQASGLARKIAGNIHGHALALEALTRLHQGELGTATEQLRAAVGLLVHEIERQESFCALGEIAESLDLMDEAVETYRRATSPTTDSLFGRSAVRALRKLVGLRVV